MSTMDDPMEWPRHRREVDADAYAETQPEETPEPRGASYGSATCPLGVWLADEVTGELVDGRSVV